MNEFDTPDKDNVYENEEEIVDSEVIDEQDTEEITDEEIQETEEYDAQDSAYEYDEEEVAEQEDDIEDVQEDADNNKGVSLHQRFMLFLSLTKESAETVL